MLENSEMLNYCQNWKEDQASYYTSQPNFQTSHVFDSNMEIAPTEIFFNKPIYLGF